MAKKKQKSLNYKYPKKIPLTVKELADITANNNKCPQKKILIHGESADINEENDEYPQKINLTIGQLVDLAHEEYKHSQRINLTTEELTDIYIKKNKYIKYLDVKYAGSHTRLPEILSKQGLMIEIGEFLYGKNTGFSLYDFKEPFLRYAHLLFLDNRDNALEAMFAKFYKKDIYIRHKLLHIINIEVYEDFYQNINFNSIKVLSN